MNSAKGKAGGTGRARPQLDRQKIAAAALALIDEKGIDHLTMRSIGAALEVEAMALYYYFSNKTDLLDGVRDYLLDQLAQRIDQQAKPLAQIRATFEALREIGLEHPDIVPTLASTRFRSERALHYYDQMIATLYRAGLSPQQSARYFAVLSHFTFGSCLHAAGTRDVRAAPGLSRAEISAQFPNVCSMAPFTSREGRDADFRFGLDMILHFLKAERQD